MVRSRLPSDEGRQLRLREALMHITLENIIDSGDASIHDVHSKASGASGTLPFTAELSRTRKQEFVFQC